MRSINIILTSVFLIILVIGLCAEDTALSQLDSPRIKGATSTADPAGIIELPYYRIANMC